MSSMFDPESSPAGSGLFDFELDPDGLFDRELFSALVTFSSNVVGSASVISETVRTIGLASSVSGSGIVVASAVRTLELSSSISAMIVTALCGEQLVGGFLVGGLGPKAQVLATVARTRSVISVVSGYSSLQIERANYRPFAASINGLGQIIVAINLDWITPTIPGSWVLVPTVEGAEILTPTVEGSNVLVPTIERSM